MTEREIWLKYGPDALRAAADELHHTQAGAERLARLMERFGRDALDIDVVLRAIDINQDPLTPWDRLCVACLKMTRNLLRRP